MNNVDQKSSWYRMPLVWMLILIPGSAVIMGVVMIWLAISNEDGLVADDYYKQGKTIIVVTHAPEIAEGYANTIYWLKDGKIEKVTKKVRGRWRTLKKLS